MTYFSYHPELKHALPRRVKMKPGLVVMLTFYFLCFTFLTYPELIVAHKYYHNAHTKLFTILCLLFLQFFFLACMLQSLLAYFKEKKLLIWGNIAEAKTFEGPAFATGRVGRFMNVHYEFKDANGNSIEGRKRFPARDVEWKSMEQALKQLDYPVVLYDPNNSNNNILYPGFYAVCLSKKE